MRPIIKKIDQKREKTVEVYLEDECILSLHPQFAKSDIASWEVASRIEFFARFGPLEEKIALQVALRKLARKAMHSEQIKSLLEGFSRGAIEKAIEELSRLGLISDEDYEAQFVKRLEKQGKSRLQIIQKAKARGIPTKCLAFGSEEELLRGLIQKRYPQLLDKDTPRPLKQKALGALYRRGFSTDLISCALKEFNV